MISMTQILKLIIYVFSILLSMWSLTCFDFEPVLLRGKLKQFYFFYFIASLGLGYLLANFIFDFVSIHL